MALVLEKYDGTSKKQIQTANGSVIEKESYYVNVTKQTAEPKNGGYEIDELNELELMFFVAECLDDFANALTEYRSQSLQ